MEKKLKSYKEFKRENYQNKRVEQIISAMLLNDKELIKKAL